MKANQTLTQSAQVLSRSCSTNSRGRGHRGHRAEQACVEATEYAQGSRNDRRIPSWVWPKVAFYHGVKWRPEQIAHELTLSHESVCLYVYADRAKGGRLHKDLRSQKTRRRRCLSGHDRRGQIPNRRTIGEQPAHITALKQVSHWESDTLIGAAHQQAIVTLVERKSGYAKLNKVLNKSADQVSQAIEYRLKPLGARVKTMKVNNGKEFVIHQQVDQALDIQTYFADLYCSWQRGSNEKINGLQRHYIPKKRRIDMVTEEELTMIKNRLNHRSRRRLGFETLHEIFYASLNHVVLQS